MQDAEIIRQPVPKAGPAIVAIMLTILAAPAASTRADELFPCELTRFEPIAADPLFKAAGPADWDARIRERGWIVRDDDGWHLWYTGYDGTREGQKKLGYASSPDGIHWSRHADNPIYDEQWVEDMMVVREGDTYYMFAEGAGDRAQLLTSTDRLHWTPRGPLDVRKANGEPIEPGPYGTPFAMRDGDTWLLFYERGDRGVWLAKSSDMKVWTNVQDEPILSPGPGPYDDVMIALNQVIRHEGHYYAYFHGTGSDEKPAIWTTNVAVSDDLIHWTKYEGNPLLPTEDNRSSGFVVFDGQQYRLYTMHDRVDVYLPACK